MKFYFSQRKIFRLSFTLVSLLLFITILFYSYYIPISNLKKTVFQLNAQEKVLSQNLIQTKEEFAQTKKELDTTIKELVELKNQDQYKINKQLEKEINNINTTYKKSVMLYEQLLLIKTMTKKTDAFDKAFAESLSFLSKKNYASAEATLDQLEKKMQETQTQLTMDSSVSSAVSSNSPPASGYQRQNVQTSSGTFLVDIIAADLNSTRVVVDTASDGNCSTNCPVLPLFDFAQRSGAFAAINGPYFCPSSYPSCADKQNSFDTLLMNKNKVYFNSDNNVYSEVPAVIFQGNSARFVTKSQDWGRDTSPDAVIANRPLLVLNGGVVFYGDSEGKHASRGGRSFIGATGNTVYIGVVRNATVQESALTLKTLGIANALNLDDGGSTALWSGKYIAGPGRSLPFGILLLRK